MTTRAAFRYRALDSMGQVERGTIEGDGRDAVVEALSRRGLIVVGIERRKTSVDNAHVMRWSDLALGLRLLANLLRAGLPMDRSLGTLAESAPDAWRRILPRVSDDVRQGQALGQALADESLGIHPLVSALVRAGEAGSGAAAAVERAATLAESIASTRAAIQQAIVYPIVLLVAGSLSLGFLIGVVLPRFAGILSELRQDPPATTKLVLAVAAVVRTSGVPAVVAAAMLLVAWQMWAGTSRGRRQWHTVLLRLPVIGPARRSLGTARAAGAIGALLESGVTLPQALSHGAAASGDEAIGAAVFRARDRVAEGVPLFRALSSEHAFTTTAHRLVRAGEDTGRLGSMLEEASRLEHASAQRLVRHAVQLIEPAFIILFGGLVGLVAAALLQALYGIRPT